MFSIRKQSNIVLLRESLHCILWNVYGYSEPSIRPYLPNFFLAAAKKLI